MTNWGVAVVMTLVERLLEETKRKHGLIRVCFTPDEEIGRGVDKLEHRGRSERMWLTPWMAVRRGRFSAGDLSGHAAEVIIDGITTHTMEAKAKGMVNAAYLAGKLLAALPRERCAPETTEGREGLIHPIHVEGRTERAVVNLLLRYFDLKGLAEKGKFCRASAEGYKPRSLGRASVARSANSIATWLTGCARTCSRSTCSRSLHSGRTQAHDHVVRGGTDGSRLTELGLADPQPLLR